MVTRTIHLWVVAIGGDVVNRLHANGIWDMQGSSIAILVRVETERTLAGTFVQNLRQEKALTIEKLHSVDQSECC